MNFWKYTWKKCNLWGLEVDTLIKNWHYQIPNHNKIGLLSKLYRFAYLKCNWSGCPVFIIHLEAAAYGICAVQIIKKISRETKGLVQLETALLSNCEFKSLIDRFLNEPGLATKQVSADRECVIGIHSGSAEKLLKKINNTLIY